MPKDAISFINKFRTLKTERYSLFNVHSKQSVLEHTSTVVFIVMLILDDLGVDWASSYGSLRIALLHDFGEVFTGDIFGNLKSKHPGLDDMLKDIGSTEIFDFLESVDFKSYHVEATAYDSGNAGHFWVIKFADILDRWLYCSEEVEMGNSRFCALKRRAAIELKRLFVEQPILKKSGVVYNIMEKVEEEETKTL